MYALDLRVLFYVLANFRGGATITDGQEDNIGRSTPGVAC